MHAVEVEFDALQGLGRRDEARLLDAYLVSAGRHGHRPGQRCRPDLASVDADLAAVVVDLQVEVLPVRDEVLAAKESGFGPDVVMLDNFSLDDLRLAVIRAGSPSQRR